MTKFKDSYFAYKRETDNENFRQIQRLLINNAVVCVDAHADIFCIDCQHQNYCKQKKVNLTP